MNKVISTEKLPIKLWLDYLEDGAKKQAQNLANLPFAVHHIAIMPDAHQGYGMPIGGVLATTPDVIIPNAIGVDIGCGMCAVKTSLFDLDKATLKNIMSEIIKVIPMGFNHHKDTQNILHMPILIRTIGKITKDEFTSARKQIGTLGGGNHFIELQKDKDNYVWIMIHSGSRNLGYKVANYYNKLAVELNEKWKSSVPRNHQLAFLPTDSTEGQAYIEEMNYCVDFALINRKLMMDRIIQVIAEIFKVNTIFNVVKVVHNFNDTKIFEVEPTINIAHNYATIENHFGKNVMVHRKGATLARKDTIGIIPGSQGTHSYIVRGKGNPDSFCSCSHGAGRTLSRSKAKATLDLATEQAKLDSQGIIHSIRNVSDLDEAAGAYKDIEEVMDNQQDLVEIITELTPLAVLKG